MSKKTEDPPQAHFDFEYSESEDEIQNFPQYGESEYWDKRYQKESKPFDWYFNWNDIYPIIKDHIESKEKSLVLGCGNSTMSYEMLQDSFNYIESIDISSSVIDAMKEKYKDFPNLKWRVMDCTDLKFYPNNSFDLVFDKGTIDALLCQKERFSVVNKTISEVYRVLNDTGKFFSITFGSPSERLEYFRNIKHDWKMLPPISVHFEYNDIKNSKTYIYI